MNYLDIIIAILLVVFGIDGLRKGIIIEAATLLGLALGLYGAFRFSDYTSAKLIQLVEIDPKYLKVVSFVVTFTVLAVLVNLLGRLVKKLIKAINLGFIDKIGGFLVGLAKGVLVCSLLVMLLNVLNISNIVKEETKQASVLYPYVERTVPYVYRGFDLVKEAVQNAAAAADAAADAAVEANADAAIEADADTANPPATADTPANHTANDIYPHPIDEK